MATDAHDSRRKHHRSSSPEDVERSSKRHKHRHHSHRHRHGSKKREEEIEYDGGTFAAVPSPTPTPNPGPLSRLPDDDVEEGEILDDVALDGEVRKRMTESDVEPGEIEVTGDRYFRSDKKIPGLLTKNSKTRSEDISNDKFISPALDAEEGTWRQSHLGHEVHEDDGSPNHLSAETQDGMDARASTDGVDNGYLARKSSKGDKRQNGELGHFKGNEKLKGDYDYEGPEANGMKVNCHRNSSSESGGEKYRMSGSSPSHDRHRSRSRSTGHTTDGSRSCGIVEEYAHSKRRQVGEKGSHYYTGRHNTDYDLDEERGRASGRERDQCSIDLVVDDRREHSTRYHCREARDRDRSRDGNVDRDNEFLGQRQVYR